MKTIQVCKPLRFTTPRHYTIPEVENKTIN